jgi:mRNA-degrading endonuclease RelE of RelBE toxin-antitoxin system
VVKYSLETKQSPQKELDALDEKLKGYKDQWRVRVGDWRVLYIINDAAKIGTITRIAHRRAVYE